VDTVLDHRVHAVTDTGARVYRSRVSKERDDAAGDPTETDEPSKPWRSEILMSDAVGRLIEFWGFKRNMGRIWTVLFLSDSPLTAKDLQERLQLSSGAVSMTVTELARWGVVKKVWVQGDRRDFFVAEGNFWKMISRVLAERERVEILEAIDAMEEALEYARAKIEVGDERERRRARRQVERIEQLLELAKLGRRLLDALLQGARVDATPLLGVLLGSRD
jgi:DNA-binding transcriptional regulator GbsR (MarR family)